MRAIIPTKNISKRCLEINQEYFKAFEFINCILNDTHVLRNWAINKLLLAKLDPWEVACLTGQTVQIIVDSYMCDLVAEINEKRARAKVQACLDRRDDRYDEYNVWTKRNADIIDIETLTHLHRENK